MARRIKLIRLPHLNDAGGDISKQWYVEYAVRNPKSDRMERFRIYEGLSEPSAEKRLVQAEKIIKEYTAKLQRGWTPFAASGKHIYQDELLYSEVAKVYGKARAGNGTIRMYASEWLKKIEASVNPDGTLPTYKGKFRLFCNWLDSRGYGENDVTYISNKIILEFFDFIIDKRQYSGNTVGKYKQILTSLFNSIIDKGKITENPVRNIRTCKRINDHTPRPIMDVDISEFRDKIKLCDPQLWLAICFQYYCFLRPGKEVRLMQIKQIDFARGTINVDRELSKTKRPKTVTIPFVFLKELRNEWRLNTYPRDYYIFSKNGEPGPVPIGKNNMRYRFNNYREKLNMPEEYKFYSWKHTGNCRADDCPEISTRDMQKQNGHSSINITENYIKNKFGSISRSIQEHFPDING
jgi:integrase